MQYQMYPVKCESEICQVLVLFHLSVDHVTPEPGGSLLAAFEHWQAYADRTACCDYSLHVDIPEWNDTVKDELELLVQEKGIPILVVFHDT